MNTKISVIIPTYKRPQLLLQCINALVQQSMASEYFEIIVVSDGYDIETAKAVASIANSRSSQNIYCIHLPVKAGPAAARNFGALHSNSSLLAFTDDDCLPDKDWVSSLWEAWNKDGRQEIAFTGRTLVPVNNPPTDYEKNIAQLETAAFITANCACTKAAFIKAGCFDEAFPVAWREDSEFHFKLLERNIPVVKAAKAVVVHPVRKAAWGISLKEQKKTIYDALLHKKHPSLFKEQIKHYPLFNYYAIVLLAFLAIISLIKNQRIIFTIAILSGTFFIGQFTIKRLSGTSKKSSHIFEMIITSAIIPFLSVYWTLRGSLRYKKLLL